LTLTGTVTTSGNLTLGGTLNLSSPPAIGGTTPESGAFTTLSVTGVTTVQAGTAALPAITTTGDTNTGIFFPAADTIAFTEGGAESMRISSAGNVGIGTSAPSAKLDLLDATNPVYLQQTRGSVVQLAGPVGSAVTSPGQIGTTSASPFRFITDNTERIRIDTAGNAQFQTGAVMPYAPAPAGISAAATLTNANIQAQIISATGTTYTITMPLGTTLETLATWQGTGIGYDFTVINTATGVITMAVNTGVTSLGSLMIAIGASAQFRIRRTAANTFVLYRLS
jgi:hypothetical protein